MRTAWMWLLGVLSSLLPASSGNATSAAAGGERAGDDIDVWPRMMRHYDIWSSHSAAQAADGDDDSHNAIPDDGMAGGEHDDGAVEMADPSIEWFDNNNYNNNNTITSNDGTRNARVLGIFPVPVDGECLSEDGRRTGNCLNPYLCRSKGGLAKGECALGFGVCCIFVANCNETIVNNITYLVSPNFPSFMSNNVTACTFKIQLMGDDISQLRIDFQHFSLGQPNRKTGVCDSDAFSVSGGPGGKFTLCGQNSGQHVYYDVLSRPLPRQALYGNLRPLTYDQLYPNLNVTLMNGSADSGTLEQAIEITMNFTKRFLPIRLWEIRIAQIPFSQRAPAGCLQFHTGAQGVIQTFNYAENGRHLANQHYRICMRQEIEMCSILYEPCDEQSFRIGPSNGMGGAVGMSAAMPAGSTNGAASPSNDMSSTTVNMATTMTQATSTTATQGTMPTTTTSTTATTTTTTPQTTTTTTTEATTASTTTTTSTRPETTNATMASTTDAMTSSTTTTTTTTPSTTTTAATTPTTTTELWPDEATTSASTSATTAATTTTSSTTTESPALLSDDVEGSGGWWEEDYEYEDGVPSRPRPRPPSRRPRPIRGGFDLLGFLRNAFDFRLRHRRRRRRGGRQFFSTCTDRITMPCIIEDFIGAGLGPLPGCEPIHCGAQFCSSGTWPCRIESTVTPFYIGINFGNGAGKGSAEDNIGACLRFSQVQCL